MPRHAVSGSYGKGKRAPLSLFTADGEDDCIRLYRQILGNSGSGHTVNGAGRGSVRPKLSPDPGSDAASVEAESGWTGLSAAGTVVTGRRQQFMPRAIPNRAERRLGAAARSVLDHDVTAQICRFCVWLGGESGAKRAG